MISKMSKDKYRYPGDKIYTDNVLTIPFNNSKWWRPKDFSDVYLWLKNSAYSPDDKKWIKASFQEMEKNKNLFCNFTI